MKTIVICSSASFYQHVNQIKTQLQELGFRVVVPASAEKMAANNDYNVDNHKTWYKNIDDMSHKQHLMREHFDKIKTGDAILVVNDEKHGVSGYIGSNVLMEMGVAFYENKKIYVLYPITKDVGCWEEVIGMGSIFLDGDISKISV